MRLRTRSRVRSSRGRGIMWRSTSRNARARSIQMGALLMMVVSHLTGFLEVQAQARQVDVAVAPDEECAEAWLGEDVEDAL